ncbi:MAG: hypothetical protein P4L87_23590 [Formivibrio sp.]|nr:hypothetical protein [Formivibrio sp.]
MACVQRYVLILLTKISPVATVLFASPRHKRSPLPDKAGKYVAERNTINAWFNKPIKPCKKQKRNLHQIAATFVLLSTFTVELPYPLVYQQGYKMLFMRWLSVFLLCLPLALFAADNTVTQGELDHAKEVIQLKVDSGNQILITRIDNQDKRIEDQKGRIDDVKSRVDWFVGSLGILITALAAVAGTFGYYSVKNKAQETAEIEANKVAPKIARETAEDWFKTHHDELEHKLIAFQKRITELENVAHENVNKTITAFTKRLESLSVNTTNSPAGNGTEEITAEDLTRKPEAEYTFQDWNTRAFAAHSDGDMEGSARYWKQAALASQATPRQIAQSLFNAGVALGAQNRIEEEMAIYEQIISRFDRDLEPALCEQVAKARLNKGIRLSELERYEETIAILDQLIASFGNTSEPTLREQVAKAMLTKAVTLGKLERYEETITIFDHLIASFGDAHEPTLREQVAKAMIYKTVALNLLQRNDEVIPIYDQIIARFGNAPEPTLREQVSHAQVGKGFKLLCLAKKYWANKSSCQQLLQQAQHFFQAALAQSPEKGIVLGNQAYCAHLLGQTSTVRDLLRQALTEGGKWLYEATLDDLAIHPAPPDTEFRVLLDEVWGEVKELAKPTGVA